MKKSLLFSTALLFVTSFIFAQTAVKYQPEIDAPATVFKTDSLNDYGGKIGIGITILDGLGIPVRYYVTPNHVLEVGPSLGGVVLSTGSDFDYYVGMQWGVGYTFFGDRFEKLKKGKIRAHGIALRGNFLTGDYPTSRASLGWAMETIRKAKPRRSFIFELGLQQVFPNFEYNGKRFKAYPGIYLRCHWNFFLK